MSALEAVLLGFVQGLTEFLPVSSSGHLTLAKALFGIDSSNLSFEVAVHAVKPDLTHGRSPLSPGQIAP